MGRSARIDLAIASIVSTETRSEVWTMSNVTGFASVCPPALAFLKAAMRDSCFFRRTSASSSFCSSVAVAPPAPAPLVPWWPPKTAPKLPEAAVFRFRLAAHSVLARSTRFWIGAA